MGLMKRIYTGRTMGQPVPAGTPLVSPVRLPDASRASSPVEAVTTVVRPTIAGEDGSGPLWLLMSGGMPVRANGKDRAAQQAVRWCREGDAEWKPIDQLTTPSPTPRPGE